MTSVNDLPIRDDLQGRSAYGAPQLDVPVQLNTNENSYPVPPEVTATMAKLIGDQLTGLNRYPDRDVMALRHDLAAYLSESTGHDVDVDHVWAANGSNEILQQILQAFGGPGRVALGFTPAYSMHPLLALGTGTGWVDGRRGPRFDLTPDDAVAQVREVDPDVVFLCSPNNPTGTALDSAIVEAVYDASDHAVVVVDEAYAEFARAGSVSAVHALPGRERLIVSRTMSKAFALAGARLGYMAADPAVVEAILLVRLPYHLSAVTQATARGALAHTETMLSMVETIKGQRDRIVAESTALGLDPIASDANFVLIGGFADAPAAWQAMLDRGVLIRDVGLPGYLRVSAGTPDETSAFLSALSEVVELERMRA